MTLRERLATYHSQCVACKLEREREIASHFWPLVAARLGSIGGTLGQWIRGKGRPEGGWALMSQRWRHLGDRADGEVPKKRRKGLEVFRKTWDEYEVTGRKAHREMEILGSKAAEEARWAVRDTFLG